MTIDEFNQLDIDSAIEALNGCCTSTRWQNDVVQNRPYIDLESFITSQENTWASLSKEDFLEAFDGHPKIGDVSSLKKKYAHTKSLAQGEQSGVDSASDEVIQRLSKLNKKYEEKFGYIFIVCATGKTALQMLTLLEERMGNNSAEEIKIAAKEQAKITKVRLEKLL
jgi:2-oxo-4-hydroxy-4-carboxy-5-ureidoimidazoline decarboxylase